jgi:hypothetical protein
MTREITCDRYGTDVTKLDLIRKQDLPPWDYPPLVHCTKPSHRLFQSSERTKRRALGQLDRLTDLGAVSASAPYNCDPSLLL